MRFLRVEVPVVMDAVSVFSWGYWGWGNATAQLCQMVDAVESARGFAPPLFVDIRYSRSVRARGFQGNAFAERVGPERYRWMRSLGNKAFGTRPRRMAIQNPGAAAELLDLAIEAAREKRRVIFFCACECPRCQGKVNCHRDEVGALLLQEARARRVSVQIVEWPGGNPSDIELTAAPATVRTVLQGRVNLPYGHHLSLAEAGGIAFGSRLTVRSPAGDVLALVGPARCHNSQWLLPLFSWWSLPLLDQSERVYPELEAEKLRELRGYQPRSS